MRLFLYEWHQVGATVASDDEHTLPRILCLIRVRQDVWQATRLDRDDDVFERAATRGFELPRSSLDSTEIASRLEFTLMCAFCHHEPNKGPHRLP